MVAAGEAHQRGVLGFLIRGDLFFGGGDQGLRLFCDGHLVRHGAQGGELIGAVLDPAFGHLGLPVPAQ